MNFKKREKRLTLNRISIAQLDSAQVLGGKAEKVTNPDCLREPLPSARCVSAFFVSCTETYC